MSKEEFSKMLLTPINLDQYKVIYSNCTPNVNKTIIPTDIPEKVDWRTKGVIGPVVDQLKCGACWAISIVTTMEAMSGIRGLGHERLSIQELFDCSTYNKKCAGGNMNAMEFLCTTKIGITTEEQYPLTFEENRCDWSKTHSGRRLKEYWIQRNMNEDDIQRQIAHRGPVIVVVNASPWQNYMDGIIQRNCFTSHDGMSLNHMVQVVGYDKTGAIPYYIIKNSWGELFGEKGYVKLAMYKNMCGFSEHVGYLDVY